MSELSEKLRRELCNQEYREGYDEAFLDHLIATQIRVIREQRQLTQGQLAEATGMKQSRISAIEDEDYGSWSVNTLRRVAYALGVRLRVYFDEWGTLLDDIDRAGRADLERRPFDEDPAFQKETPTPDNVESMISYLRGKFTAEQQTAIAQQNAEPSFPKRRPPKSTLPHDSSLIGVQHGIDLGTTRDLFRRPTV
jgi:transcriptional regulator with XRE-family HTH domain